MSCVICGHQPLLPIYHLLNQCPNCGHAVYQERVSTQQSAELYDAHYFTFGEYYSYANDAFAFDLNFNQRLKDVRRFCPSGNLVEIGCANGLFLRKAKQYFSVVGFEVSQPMAELGRQSGLDIRNQNFCDDKTLAQNSLDAIVLWDVIEHLPDPIAVIKKSHKLLKKDGVIAMTTGDIESQMAKRQGRAWRLIHPPTHLHYFSKRSLTQSLKDNGFDLVKISYPGYWRGFGQMLFGVFPKLMSKEGWAKFDRWPIAHIPIYLNVFDIMHVIGKKR